MDATAPERPEAPERIEDLESRLDPALFKALCDPNRLALVARLAGGPLSVSEASECCGVHVSGTSRHLKLLERAGVVRASRRGREVRYALDAPTLVAALRGLADAIEECGRATGCCGPRADANDDPPPGG